MSQSHPSQFALLRQRRFAPFFWTQFFGAGNDNVLKFAFTVLVTYQLQVSWLPAENSSSWLREKPHFAAINSALMPCGTRPSG